MFSDDCEVCGLCPATRRVTIEDSTETVIEGMLVCGVCLKAALYKLAHEAEAA